MTDVPRETGRLTAAALVADLPKAGLNGRQLQRRYPQFPPPLVVNLLKEAERSGIAWYDSTCDRWKPKASERPPGDGLRPLLAPKVCKACGDEFVPTHTRQLYCPDHRPTPPAPRVVIRPEDARDPGQAGPAISLAAACAVDGLVAEPPAAPPAAGAAIELPTVIGLRLAKQGDGFSIEAADGGGRVFVPACYARRVAEFLTAEATP